MGHLSDGGQDDCTFVSVVQEELDPVRALTLPLGIQDRDHGGRAAVGWWAGDDVG